MKTFFEKCHQTSFCRRFRKNYWITVFIFLVVSIVIYKFNFLYSLKTHGDNYWDVLYYIGASISSAIAYSFIIQILVSIRSGFLHYLLSYFLMFATCVLSISEIFILNKYGTPFTTNIINSIFSSNVREGAEFVYSINLSFVYKEILLIAVFFVFSYFVVKKYSPRRVVFIVILLLQLIGSFIFFRNFLKKQIKEYQDGVVKFLIMNSLERATFSYITYIDDQRFLKNSLSQINTMKLNKLYVNENIDSLNIVIILGESLRRNSMHCYGANIPNTPNIDSMIYTKDIILYKDVVCSACNTNPSVSKIFTMYDDTNNYKKKFLEYHTLFNVLRQSGYYTYWVSNQEKSGIHVSDVCAIASSCDSTKYSMDINYSDMAGLYIKKYDETILPLLLKGEDVGKSKFATVIHLMGSHASFCLRYPEAYNRFGFGDKTSSEMKSKLKEVLEYSNSILYNDYIIKQIIDFYKNTPSIIFYFSDHGLDLFDNPDRPEVSSHSVSAHAAPVPFMVYISPEIRRRSGDYSSMVRNIENAKDKAISLDMFTNSLVNLLGIQTEYDSRYTQFFSPLYIEPNVRKVGGFSGQVQLYIDTIHTVPDNWDYKINE